MNSFSVKAELLVASQTVATSSACRMANTSKGPKPLYGAEREG
jgi:hypothetical protein